VEHHRINFFYGIFDSLFDYVRDRVSLVDPHRHVHLDMHICKDEAARDVKISESECTASARSAMLPQSKPTIALRPVSAIVTYVEVLAALAPFCRS
jgi:hypothetical protein